MANEEHAKIITQGVRAWNRWRKENINVKPDLIEIDLRNFDLYGVNLKEVDLSWADLTKTNLTLANLQEANLRGANLQEANLTAANLTSTSLRLASLTDAILNNTILNYADLTSTFLVEAYLKNVDLDKTNFSQVFLKNTVLTNLNLSEVVGLETVEHLGPSHIDIDTIYKSGGSIPEVFLRGVGVPENFITYMGSLTGKAFEFYTCFISYTEADNVFSLRLYNDLQGAGVRCWRWPEDAEMGKTLRKSIDEAVRTYDRLIVILSEKSLKSRPVVEEIERALNKEDHLFAVGKDDEVLFPIRLDDTIFNWDNPLKDRLLNKYVGNFSEWEKSEIYSKAFDHLVRSLKPKIED